MASGKKKLAAAMMAALDRGEPKKSKKKSHRPAKPGSAKSEHRKPPDRGTTIRSQQSLPSFVLR